MKQGESMVFVVDDDRFIRDALASLLASIQVRVRCFASAQEFLRYRRPECPACLVLDVRMPGLSGLDLQRSIAHSGQSLPIIFLTAHGDIRMAVGAMKEGAAEFLPKPFREEELLDAIRNALERDRATRQQRSSLVALQRRHDQLTSREREVLEGLAQGKLNKQIAAALGISEVTVKVHRRNVMEKMGAETFAELIRMTEQLH
jgi:FixJ family two-component response regulator